MHMKSTKNHTTKMIYILHGVSQVFLQRGVTNGRIQRDDPEGSGPDRERLVTGADIHHDHKYKEVK